MLLLKGSMIHVIPEYSEFVFDWLTTNTYPHLHDLSPCHLSNIICYYLFSTTNMLHSGH